LNLPKSSVELDKENYFGYVQQEILGLYAISFGGSKKEALEFYLKAREIIEKKPENINKNWNYLSLLVVIGQSYYYLNQYASAKSVYDRILELEPGFLYVKDDLYPRLLKKLENS
jgi:tetratricopeptide (TPR) repeat protein